VNVLILDDHALVRQGLALLLDQEDDIAVVGEAESLATLPDVTCGVDVVVADLILDDGEGADVITAVLKRYPAAQVVAVTMLGDPEAAMRSLEAGASGYVSKHAAADDLVDALRRVSRGERYVEPSVGAQIASQQLTRNAALSALSPRETDVLLLIAAGYTNTEIARELTIGLRTVEAHRSSALRKLGLRTRADVVRYCWDAGLVRPPH
jgi:DNA-binding NarL/FixJ family response regulator